MSDQKRWIKLWLCLLDDPDLMRLSPQDLGRWFLLLALVGQHGEGGSWYLRGGWTDLPPRWRVGLGSEGVRDALSRLPSLEVRDDEFPSHGMTITFTKWHKYQTDSSSERTKRWRLGRQPRDGEPASQVPNLVTIQEKRREDKNPPTPRAHAPESQHDCGHEAHELLKLSCSDRHFAAHRDWLKRNAPPREPITIPAWMQDQPPADDQAPF